MTYWEIGMVEGHRANPIRNIGRTDMRYALRAAERAILTKCSKHGTTVHSIEFSRLKKFTVPIAPCDEQKRIAAKLDELFSKIEKGEENLKRAQELLKQYRQSVLKAAVTGELTREWREKHRGQGETGEELLQRILAARRAAWEAAELAKMKAKGKLPKDDSWKRRYNEPSIPEAGCHFELPSGWVWASVDQLTSMVQYGTSAKCNDGSYGVPVIRMGNIGNGKIDYRDLKYLPKDHSEFPELLLQPGDLLFNRTNSAELVGKSAIYNGQFERCSFASYLIRLRTIAIDAKWVVFFLSSSFGRTWAGRVKSQQVGQANINGTKLKSLAIPLPPTDELLFAVEMTEEALSLADVAAANLGSQLTRFMTLRRSVLNSAFSGKLVPQDPNDEPASVLLERIAVERVAREGAQKSRRGRRIRTKEAAE